MIRLLDVHSKRIRSGSPPDLEFLSEAVDFIRTYADRCHHGKEEDILFRDLGRKALSSPDAAAMNDLTKDHVWARGRAKELIDAAAAWRSGAADAAGRISKALEELASFYPEHIRKEDQEFFPVAMKYFIDDERARMLAEMSEFDRKLIHEHYRAVVGRFEPPKGK
jgi:hemerythrin-like domain-containing protein